MVEEEEEDEEEEEEEKKKKKKYEEEKLEEGEINQMMKLLMLQLYLLNQIHLFFAPLSLSTLTSLRTSNRE